MFKNVRFQTNILEFYITVTTCANTHALTLKRLGLGAALKLAISDLGRLYFGSCTNTQNN